jgi:hypothetical protein
MSRKTLAIAAGAAMLLVAKTAPQWPECKPGLACSSSGEDHVSHLRNQPCWLIDRGEVPCGWTARPSPLVGSTPGRHASRKSRWNANIRLTMKANQLVWSSERGVAQYYRCRSR